MNKEFSGAITERRTVYDIGNKPGVTDDRIAEIVKHAVKYTPTAFNSQSGRVVLLLGAQHERLWDITMGILKKIVPKENFGPTETKINSFKAGYGTVLFYEDQQIVENLQKNFPLYKDNFPVWSQQASGILQFIVWELLELEGLGANLQHYNPLIDEEVAKTWQIPEKWKLTGQMPFGNPTASPDEKTFLPVDDRIKVFK